MTFLRRMGAAIADHARAFAGSENRAAAILVGTGFVLILAALLVARYIAGEIANEATQRFDIEFLKGLHAAKDDLGRFRHAADEFFEDVTALGGTPGLTLITLFVSVFFALCGRREESVLTVIVALGSLVLTTALKLHFARERPTLLQHDASGYSFPSGHAFSSMAIYVTYGVLLARLAPTWPARVFATGSTVALAVLIAFSRCWLGVHYLTDILAGAAGGLAWSLTVLCAAEVFRRGRARRSAAVGEAGDVPRTAHASPTDGLVRRGPSDLEAST